jgi:RNA polymerase sigma-70 factor (ECF subfamily)
VSASDERDFDQLYVQNQRALHAYLLGRTGDREAARDLLQEVFLRAWRRVDAWSELPAARRRAWLFTVARNVVIDTHRARRGVEIDLEDAGAEVAAPASEEPPAQAERGERLARLDQAIRRLPERLRLVLSLHVVGGLTSAQVGELLDEPAGTIRYRLNQARRLLAADMGDVR